jgi:hypothetical protein
MLMLASKADLTSVALLVLLVSVFSCKGILAFTLGKASTVFWILSACRCPLCCKEYTGKYQKKITKNW